MEKQTQDREELYAREEPPGAPIPINVEGFAIEDGVLEDGEIRVAVRKLNNGRAGGTAGMRGEDLKRWLQGAEDEEDPEKGAMEGAGDTWRLFVRLL